MTKRYSIDAVAFLIGGLLVTFGLYCLISLGNSMGGAGDGATSGGTASPFFIVTLYGCYFGCGIIASFTAKRAARKYLGVLGHLSLLFVLIAEWRTLLAFLVIDLVIVLLFGFVWYDLLCQPKDNANSTNASG